MTRKLLRALTEEARKAAKEAGAELLGVEVGSHVYIRFRRRDGIEVSVTSAGTPRSDLQSQLNFARQRCRRVLR